MNYEDKLRLAKEALASNSYDRETIEYIFPELKESEDERIRKAIFKALSKKDARDALLANGIQVSDALAWVEKQGEQKPVEQDTEVHDLWVYIREWNDKFGRLPKDEDELAACIDYVMKRQKLAEWSEEDERMLGKCIDAASGYYSPEDKQSIKDWLKSLKDRVQPQPKQEWSEGIKSRLDEISDFLQYKGREDDAEFIKFIKPNHWKPSEEQMQSLLYALGMGGIFNHEALTQLYNDLKKL